jgi:CheY-like chemotaxis protein
MKQLEDNLVFVVEDNEMQSMMMDYVLSKENPYKVVRFKSGEECLANLSRNPDIIVLDYSLPGMNGMETFKAIKKYNPTIPVFIISATEDKQLEEQFLEAGIYSYIVKKSDAFHNLSDTIASLLSNSVSIPEHNYSHRLRMKLIFSVGFILLVAVAGLLYFVMGKHLH